MRNNAFIGQKRQILALRPVWTLPLAKGRIPAMPPPENPPAAPHGEAGALLPLEIMQSMELDKIAPVPPQTRKRGPLFVRAFRAYAYEGMRWAPQLSKLTGLTANMIRKARSVDKWDAFIGSTHDRETAARYGITASTVSSILPADGHKVAERESVERGETCKLLQGEIAAIRVQLAGTADKASVGYQRLLANLRTAREELDGLLGISRLDKAREAGAIQKARIEATPPVRKAPVNPALRNGNASPLAGRQIETDCVDVSSFILPPLP
jgi:hypothetical protein